MQNLDMLEMRLAVAMDVGVSHLNLALRNFLDQQIKIIYIHDF